MLVGYFEEGWMDEDNLKICTRKSNSYLVIQ